MSWFKRIKQKFGNKQHECIVDPNEFVNPGPKTILQYIQQSDRFECRVQNRHYYLLNEDKTIKGIVYYKSILGGWMIKLASDNTPEDTLNRGAIHTINQLKEYL